MLHSFEGCLALVRRDFAHRRPAVSGEGGTESWSVSFVSEPALLAKAGG